MLGEHFSNRPTELAPLEGEHHDWLLRVRNCAHHKRVSVGRDRLRCASQRRRWGGGRNIEAIIGRRARDGQLLLGHLHWNLAEKRRAQIALSGIRQYAQDGGTRWWLIAHLQCAGEGRARRNTHEDPLFLREVTRQL